MKRRFIKLPITFCFTCIFLYSVSTEAQTISSTGSKVARAEAAEALRFHNEARSEVGVAPLQWSANLAAYAQAWAEHLAANGCQPKHRPYEGEWKQLYGENIFWGNGRAYVALDASKGWYEEKKKYTYGPVLENNLYETGHYTQMVWRNSTTVGLGTARCPNGAVIIVANYDPRGNYMGQKPY